MHCDRRTPLPVFAGMVRDHGPLVRVLPRRATHVASWSLVDAELRALRVWLSTSRSEHVIVLSGACYPLVSVERLCAELAGWRGLSRLRLNPLPHRPWDTPRNPDGGLWRVRRRFVTWGGRVVYVGNVPLRTVRRRPPRGLELRASSQWKIYARPHVAALLAALDEHPELVRFWRTTLVPDELCAASILSSPELVGEVAGQVCDDLPWYLDWERGARHGHPRWLGVADLPALAAARAAPPRAVARFVSDRDAYRKLFARKIASTGTELLDAIDATLRV